MACLQALKIYLSWLSLCKDIGVCDSIQQFSDLLDLASFDKFISFRSISCSEKFSEDLIACANWLADYLRTFCEEVCVFPTTNKPVVFAKCRANSAKKEPLGLYGHYDIQPADPLQDWWSDPFSLSFKSGRLYGRGAQDNKGQLWYGLQALKFLKTNKQLERDVFLLIEGEEESDGSGTEGFLKSQGKQLFGETRSFLLTDSIAITENLETICLGVRGIGWLEVEISGATFELHQGVHGGLAPNPAHELFRIWSSACEHNFRNVEGFWEGWIGGPSQEALNLVASFQEFQDNYYKQIGAQANFKPPCHPWLIGFFPAVDVVGLEAGYTDEGIKPSIPPKASVKLSIRSAFNQSTIKVVQSLKNFLKSNLRQGYSVRTISEGASCDPYLISLDNPYIQKVADVIKGVTGNQVIFNWSGGSLPIVKTFGELGILPVVFGFGLPEDNIHAPNESFKLTQMLKGFNVVKNLVLEL